MTTTTITLRPGERRPWVTNAGSVVLRDSDGYPSYDPDTLAPVNSTIQWAASPWRSDPRSMTWRVGNTVVQEVLVTVLKDEQAPAEPPAADPHAPHPDWNPALVRGLPRLPQGGVKTTPDPRVALPINVDVRHVPGAWEVYWSWNRLEEPADRRGRAEAVQVFARPTRERGSGSAWTSILREYSSTGRGQPWGPWKMSYPRAVAEDRGDGQQVMEPFPPETLFDLRLVVHGARFPLDIGVTDVVGQGLTTPTGKQPPGVSVSVWQSRLLPTIAPVTAEDITSLTTVARISAQSLAVRAAMSSREVPSEALRGALRAAGCDLALYGLDHDYRAVSEAVLDEWLAADDTDAASYVDEAWDCDNYATALCARASSTLGNCCGIVVDYSGGHAYNVFLVTRRQDDVAVRFVEPQTDGTVQLGDSLGDHEAYSGQRGYIHFP